MGNRQESSSSDQPWNIGKAQRGAFVTSAPVVYAYMLNPITAQQW